MKYNTIEEKLIDRVEIANSVQEAIQIFYTAKTLYEMKVISKDVAKVVIGWCADIADDLNENVAYMKACVLCK